MVELAGELEALEAEARQEISAAADPQALAEVRARFLGRKGSLRGLLRGIGSLPPEERARAGEAANRVKDRIEALVRERREALRREAEARSLAGHRLDVTLPGAGPAPGHLHPLTRLMRDVTRFFHGLGFSVEDGPEVETEYHNFEALNFPPDHPAWDLQDTFFVRGGHVLRTHTSPVQIRVMTGREPPFRFLALGRVYRHDSDPTHSPMFHQVEGFLVDDGVSFADLKGVLFAFARHLFGDDTGVRFRAHYFPFTEPSAEIDFSWRGAWLEVGGCGMIHPNVLRECGLDPERYQGFAFGLGLDRIAMVRHGIPHIGLLFDADQRVLEQL